MNHNTTAKGAMSTMKEKEIADVDNDGLSTPQTVDRDDL
jgi:hypothetical protein